MKDISIDQQILRSRQSMIQALQHKKLGFGSLHLKELRIQDICLMFDSFLDVGFLYFEAAAGYENEEIFRKCLTSRYERSRYLLADKLPLLGGRTNYSQLQFVNFFHESLKRCGVQYFDFYLLHNLSFKACQQSKSEGLFDTLVALKERGLANYIGVSSHDPVDVLEKMLEEHHNKLDFVQLQINYFDWESTVIQSRECYELAVKYELPVFVMAPAKGGALFNLPATFKTEHNQIEGVAMPAVLAYKFTASLENVACVLSGMTTVVQVRENTAIFREPCVLTAMDQKAIREACIILRNSVKIQCTGCKYCLSICDKHIPIPELVAMVNFPERGGYYAQICSNGKGKASDCVKCGKCELACPQKIAIRGVLDEVYRLYEKKPRKSHLKKLIQNILQRLGLLYAVRGLYRKLFHR